MKKVLNSRPTLAAIVSGALILGLVLGGMLSARDSSDGQSAASEATEEEETSRAAGSVATTSGGGTESTAGAEVEGGATSSGARPTGGGAIPPGGDQPGVPGELRPVMPANNPGYAYRDVEGGLDNTGTLPPPSLPVKVSMTSTTMIVDGQPITIKIEPTEATEMYGFEARICRNGALFRGLYDFFPTVAGTCAATPLSAGSDAYLRVQASPPYQVGEGTIRAGVGTSSFTTEDGEAVSVTCGRDDPCTLVLMVQVPYGFGFLEYPLTFA